MDNFKRILKEEYGVKVKKVRIFDGLLYRGCTCYVAFELCNHPSGITAKPNPKVFASTEGILRYYRTLEHSCHYCKHKHGEGCPSSEKCYSTEDNPYFELGEVI